MKTVKEDRLGSIERRLRDLDELEQKARDWFQKEPWFIDEINKKRFQLINEMDQQTPRV